MTQTEHKPQPGALELARHVLNIPDGAPNPVITSVEIRPDFGGTLHYITGPDDKQIRISMYGDGTFSACHMNTDGTCGQQIMNGQIYETSAEPVIRAHTEEIIAALTGHKVKTQNCLQECGTFIGRYLSPVNDRDSMNDHNFLYHEDALGGFTLLKTLTDPETDTPAFEGSPFAKGNVADILSRDVRYTCKLQITDPELFNDEMAIFSIGEFNSRTALKWLLVHHSTLALEDVGINSLDVQDIKINIEHDNDLVEMTVIADIKDHRAMIAAARNAYATCWQDNDWYPESAAEALWELTLASNNNPSPDLLGFEIMDMKAVKPVISEIDHPENDSPEMAP